MGECHDKRKASITLCKMKKHDKATHPITVSPKASFSVLQGQRDMLVDMLQTLPVGAALHVLGFLEIPSLGLLMMASSFHLYLLCFPGAAMAVSPAVWKQLHTTVDASDSPQLVQLLRRMVAWRRGCAQLPKISPLSISKECAARKYLKSQSSSSASSSPPSTMPAAVGEAGSTKRAPPPFQSNRDIVIVMVPTNESSDSEDASVASFSSSSLASSSSSQASSPPSSVDSPAPRRWWEVVALPDEAKVVEGPTAQSDHARRSRHDLRELVGRSLAHPAAAAAAAAMGENSRGGGLEDGVDRLGGGKNCAADCDYSAPSARRCLRKECGHHAFRRLMWSARRDVFRNGSGGGGGGGEGRIENEAPTRGQQQHQWQAQSKRKLLPDVEQARVMAGAGAEAAEWFADCDGAFLQASHAPLPLPPFPPPPPSDGGAAAFAVGSSLHLNRGHSHGGRQQQQQRRRLEVERFRWCAETIDRQTGGRVALEVKLALWPKHLPPPPPPPPPLPSPTHQHHHQTMPPAQAAPAQAVPPPPPSSSSSSSSTAAAPTSAAAPTAAAAVAAAAPLVLVFRASVQVQDTPVMRVADFEASLYFTLFSSNAAAAVTDTAANNADGEHNHEDGGDGSGGGGGGGGISMCVFNSKSSGAEEEWPREAVHTLSTALFGRPTGRRLLGRFLVALLNPGGPTDGGAFRCAFEDSLLFGDTDVFDDDFAAFRRMMSDRLF